MAYKGFRPDLFNRIQNRIIAGTFPKQRFTAEELGDFFGEPAWQVLECISRLVSLGWCQPLTGPDKGDDRRARMRRLFRGHRPRKQNPERAEYEILKDHWTPPMETVRPELGSQMQCPKCGRPIKRRHQRGEFHDPDKCTMNNIRDIMTK